MGEFTETIRLVIVLILGLDVSLRDSSLQLFPSLLLREESFLATGPLGPTAGVPG
jgi:hypothetical protein